VAFVELQVVLSEPEPLVLVLEALMLSDLLELPVLSELLESELLVMVSEVVEQCWLLLMPI
jgi:hypothetical protein